MKKFLKREEIIKNLWQKEKRVLLFEGLSVEKKKKSDMEQTSMNCKCCELNLVFRSAVITLCPATRDCIAALVNACLCGGLFFLYH